MRVETASLAAASSVFLKTHVFQHPIACCHCMCMAMCHEAVKKASEGQFQRKNTKKSTWSKRRTKGQKKKESENVNKGKQPEKGRQIETPDRKKGPKKSSGEDHERKAARKKPKKTNRASWPSFAYGSHISTLMRRLALNLCAAALGAIRFVANIRLGGILVPISWSCKLMKLFSSNLKLASFGLKNQHGQPEKMIPTFPRQKSFSVFRNFFSSQIYTFLSCRIDRWGGSVYSCEISFVLSQWFLRRFCFDSVAANFFPAVFCDAMLEAARGSLVSLKDIKVYLSYT